MRAYKVFRRWGSKLLSRSPARVKVWGTREVVADALRYNPGEVTKALPGSLGIFVYNYDDEELRRLKAGLEFDEELWEVECPELRMIFTRFRTSHSYYYVDKNVVALLKKPGVRVKDFHSLDSEALQDVGVQCWVTDWVIPIKLVAVKKAKNKGDAK